MHLRSRMRAWSGGVAERLIAPVLKTGRPKGLVSSNLTPSATINFGLPISDLRSAAEENARRSERRRSPRPRHTQHRTNNARRDTFAISRSELEWESRRGRSVGLPETSYRRKRLKRQRGRTGMSDTWS